MKNDAKFLKLAAEEGKKGHRPYGAVVVIGGKIISKQHSNTFETNDPSGHAEINALKAACLKTGDRHLPGATLYASHEPCIMCFACAVFVEIDRIVFGVPAPELSSTYGFKDSDIFTMVRRSLTPIKVEQMDL